MARVDHPDPAHREEGGTPAIVESVRAGLVFSLKEAMGADTNRELEEDFARSALHSWTQNPRILVPGNPKLRRVSIVRFDPGTGLWHHRNGRGGRR